MKRYLSLLLIVLLLPALLAVPARAEEYTQANWVNLLDFGYIFGDSNFLDLPSYRNYVSFELGGGDRNFYYDIDIIVKTDSTTLSLSKWAGGSPALTAVNLGDGFYRFYGDIERNYANQALYFHYSDGTYLDVVSAKASVISFARYEKVVSGIVYDYGAVPAAQSAISYQGDGNPSGTVEISASSYEASDFRVDLDVYHWQTMDYIELSMSSFCSSIDSIQVMLNGVNVPYEVNYLDINKSSDTGLALIDLLIDLRGLDRTSTSTLVVQVTGAVQSPRVGNFVIQHCLGLIAVDLPSPLTYWFTQLRSWISDQTSALTSGLSNIVSTIGSGFTNIGTWITNQTNSIGTWFNQQIAAVQTWGQNIVSSIDALPDKIAEALQGLFVPSESAVQNMGQQSEELAQDRFGGVYEGAQIVDNFASQLKPEAATQILTVPVVELNILGKAFPLGGWDVDLVPEGTEIIVETCKIVIDIIATLAFINGLKSRLERTLEQ